VSSASTLRNTSAGPVEPVRAVGGQLVEVAHPDADRVAIVEADGQASWKSLDVPVFTAV